MTIMLYERPIRIQAGNGRTCDWKEVSRNVPDLIVSGILIIIRFVGLRFIQQTEVKFMAEYASQRRITSMLIARHSLLQSAANFDFWSFEGRQFLLHALIDLFYDLQKFIKPWCLLKFGAFGAKFSHRIELEHPTALVIAFEENTYNYKHFTRDFDFEVAGMEYKNLPILDQY